MKFAQVNGTFVRYEFAMGGPAIRDDGPVPRNPSRSGYGDRIPTEYRVRTINQVWRRVYCTIYSNSGTCWINQNGERIIVDIQP